MTPKTSATFSSDPFATGFGTKDKPAKMESTGNKTERPPTYVKNLSELRKLLEAGVEYENLLADLTKSKAVTV